MTATLGRVRADRYAALGGMDPSKSAGFRPCRSFRWLPSAFLLPRWKCRADLQVPSGGCLQHPHVPPRITAAFLAGWARPVRPGNGSWDLERLGGAMSEAATEASLEIGPFPSQWRRRHLLGLEELSADEICLVLDKAQQFRRRIDAGQAKLPLLTGKTCVNLFFENSTRTRTSFALAARRLGADMVDFSAATSSLSKGETVIDTAKNIEAMGVDVVVVRHRTPGTPHLLAQNLDCSVVNAGDGPHEHPTQGLLDILTIRQRLGRIEGLTVALIGDIAHSRTARSNIWGLKKLGAHIIVCGPSTLVSPRWAELGVEYSYSLDDILPRVDVLNLLRIQFERQFTRPFPSVREYALLYTMDRKRLARAKPDILILAPGPINRGVEVTPEVADGPHSAILDQVTNGVAVRMAVLWLVTGAGDAGS